MSMITPGVGSKFITVRRALPQLVRMCQRHGHPGSLEWRAVEDLRYWDLAGGVGHERVKRQSK